MGITEIQAQDKKDEIIHYSTGRLILFALWILLVSPPLFGAAEDSPRSKAYYHFLLGALKERSREYSGAIEEYREALKYDANSSEILSHLAELYIQTNRMDEAIQEARKAIEKNPDSKEAHRMLGQIYLEKMYMTDTDRKDLTNAIREFHEVQRIDPTDEGAMLTLGQLYLQNSEPKAAVELLGQYLERNPDSTIALLTMASAYQQLNQPDQAIAYLNRYLQQNPDNLNTLQQIADLYEKKGDSTRALEFLKRAYDMNSEHPGIVRKYVESLGKNQNFTEAIRILEERIQAESHKPEWNILLAVTLQKSGNQERAEGILKQEIASNPNDSDVRFALVQVYEDGRKFREALQTLDEMIQKVNTDTSLGEKERRADLALIYSHKGYSAQQLKDYEHSVEYYRKAREFVDPADQGKIDFYIALNYRGQKKWDEAIKTVNSILEADPNDADSWELLSLIYEEKGDKENSDKVIRHLMETHPDSAEYYILKAQRLQQRQNYAESISFLKGYLSKFPENDQIFFLLGAASERLKKIDEAEEYFKQAITVNPKNANALNYLGYMLIDKGIRLEESIEYVKRALEIDRDNGAFMDSLGWGYFKMNRLDLAEDNLRMALERMDNEETAVVHDHIGDLYFKQGKFQDAIRHWEIALQGEESEEIDPQLIRKKIDDTKNRLR